ncbi:MAG: DMT family transporter [Roseburia sp.]|nr:DMT family transporter [Roseburia sp.]
MNKFVMRQSLLLLLTAIIWGVAFVAQSVGMDYVGPFTFITARSAIGAIVLVPYIMLRQRRSEEKEGDEKHLILGGICCGVLLFVASSLQQIGVMHTTVGKAGFVTAMYIVIVPLIGIFFRKKAGIKLWSGVALAVTGLYFLCMTSGSVSIQMGDMLTFLCAIAFAFQIMAVDYFAPKVDGVKLSFMQFVVCIILGGVATLLFESPSVEQIWQAWLPILYAGALSSGVGYTLQIVGQRGMNPTVASLIMSMESVVSVIAGWAILGEALSGRELLGCALMFGAIILVQLPEM